MENIKEEKAREYAEVQYGDPRKYEYRSQLDKFEECLEHFKAGFDAGKQERDRETLEWLKELHKDYERFGHYQQASAIEYVIRKLEIENLPK